MDEWPPQKDIGLQDSGGTVRSRTRFNLCSLTTEICQGTEISSTCYCNSGLEFLEKYEGKDLTDPFNIKDIES